MREKEYFGGVGVEGTVVDEMHQAGFEDFDKRKATGPGRVERSRGGIMSI